MTKMDKHFKSTFNYELETYIWIAIQNLKNQKNKSDIFPMFFKKQKQTKIST